MAGVALVAALAAPTTNAPARPARVLVAQVASAPAPAGSHLVARFGAVATWRLDAPARGARRLAARLGRRPGVLAAQVGGELRAAQDPPIYRGFCQDSPPSDVDRTVPSAVDALSAPAAGAPSIAVLDTGVDPAAAELSGHVLAGVNALKGGTDTRDTDSHGTGVAGVAAAAPGLVQGVAPGAPIVPITIFDDKGNSTADVLVKAIGAAVAKGAKVINISGANPADQTSASEQRVVRLAILQAVDAGAQVVVASGNDGSPAAQVPASFPHVLTVGAIDQSGARAGFSSTGRWLDVMAPAEDLIAPAPKALCPSGYATARGTSFAAPAVAGAAALLAAAKPSLSAAQRDAVLRASAADLGTPGWDSENGFGLLDVAKALAAPAPVPDGPEIDDDVYWVSGPQAPKHPWLVSPARRSASVAMSVNAVKDPADVVRVHLKAGDRLKVTVQGPKKTGSLDLTLWDPKTPRFGIGENTDDHVESDGIEDGTRLLLNARVKKAGTYYLSVTTTETAPQDPAPLAYKLSASVKPRARRSG